MDYSFSKEEKNATKIDTHVHLTQSVDYGTWQKALGREIFCFELTDEKHTILIEGQYIAYPLIKGFTYWYAPYGPTIKKDTPKEAVSKFIREIHKEAKRHSAVFVRHEFDQKYGFKKTSKLITDGSYTQPRHEWHINLTQTEAEILANMEQKTRYNIKLAQKKELIPVIDTKLENEGNKKTFLKLMEHTSTRNNFRLHEKKYYETILNTPSTDVRKTLILIYSGTTPLAGNLLITYGDTTHYLFGGSSDTHKNLMGSYLIQWIGIQEARRIGSQWYSFGALLGEKENKKSWTGITHFKKRFGGAYNIHPPIYDDIINRKIYYIYGIYKILNILKKTFLTKQ